MAKRTDITLNQLRYFVRVADLGSMSAAADELYVAQSAVSSGIAHLEANLGVQLLIRQRAKGVVLTESGKTFYAAVQKVLRQLDSAVEMVAPQAVAGPFVAGCFTTLAQFWLSALMEEMKSNFGGLNVELREFTAEELPEALSKREIEIALAYDFDYGREIDFIPVGTIPLYAAFAEEHRFASRESIEISELANEPMVLLDLGKSSNYFLSTFHAAGIKPIVKYRFQSFETVRSMVARGHGFTVLNQSPVHDLTNEGLRISRVPLTGVEAHLSVGVVCRQGEELSTKATAFLEAVRDVYSLNFNFDKR